MKMLLENLGCKPAYEVYKTKNYSLFKESFDNRIDFTNEPTTSKYKKLKESVEKCGKNLEPITVREIESGTKFEVIKGHHRYWATRMTNSELYFRIDNTSTLDESIEETKGTSNWTDNDLLERGVRHNVELCTIIRDMENRFPLLKNNKLNYRLIWGYLSSISYPTRHTMLKKLASISGIQELKNIYLDKDDESKLREFLFRFIETIQISSDKYNEVKDSKNDYNTINLSTTAYIDYFIKYYKIISRNYEDYIKEWSRICSVKSNKTTTLKDKDIYRYMTSKDGKFIEKAIMEICTRI